MKYQTIITDKANEQLHDIIMYISDESKSKEVALNYLSKIEEAILKLEDFPFMGVKPKYLVLKKQGYLVLIFEIT
jgi:toxin ParE1/3/4